MDYSEVHYDNPCISQSIIRLDFLEFIDHSVLFNEAMDRLLLSYYPRKGMQQIIRFQTMNITTDFNGSKTENTMIDGVQQEFFDIEGNRIILSNRFIILEANKYTSYEVELDKLMRVLKQIVSIKEVTVTRAGIRYINEFGGNRLKPQKSFFVAPVSALVDTKRWNTDSTRLIRSMALDEYSIDDMHLNFRYGQFNPRYPAPITSSSFVLDFDCYCEDALFGVESIIAHITKGHDAIQGLFEETITDKLRKLM